MQSIAVLYIRFLFLGFARHHVSVLFCCHRNEMIYFHLLFFCVFSVQLSFRWIFFLRARIVCGFVCVCRQITFRSILRRCSRSHFDNRKFSHFKMYSFEQFCTPFFRFAPHSICHAGYFYCNSNFSLNSFTLLPFCIDAGAAGGVVVRVNTFETR